MEYLHDEQEVTIENVYGASESFKADENRTRDLRAGALANGRARGYSRRGFLGVLAAAAAVGAVGLSGCAPKREREVEQLEERHELVVVGAGAAGMCAAITAYDRGVRDIVILEKMGNIGGNSNFSSSGMNASETKFQIQQGIEDSSQLFAQETFDGGHKTANRELVDFMCEHSAASIEWLDGLGITLDNLTRTGGMSVRRCHRPTDGSAIGLTLVPGLERACKERGIEIVMNAEALSFLTDDSGAVIGVRTLLGGTKDIRYVAKAVVNAAGGMGSNKELIAKYRPDLKDYISTNQPGATGDGYVMAEKVGAELVQMDQIQIHPTVEQSTATLIAEGVRGSGAILVNSEGRRFFNEMSTRDRVSAAELEQPGKFAWEVFDQQVYDGNKAIKNTYDAKGLVVKGASLEDLAAKIGVDAATLRETVDAYNAITLAGATDEFGRTQGCIAFAEGAFYAVKVAPGVHHQMGGVRMNLRNEALRADGTPVPGLFVAGEVTGGVHGNNRIGGNAVCDITTFGRTCGESAADYVLA